MEYMKIIKYLLLTPKELCCDALDFKITCQLANISGFFWHTDSWPSCTKNCLE